MMRKIMEDYDEKIMEKYDDNEVAATMMTTQ